MGQLPQNPTGADAGAAAEQAPDAATDWPEEQINQPDAGGMPEPAGGTDDGEDFVDPEGGRPGGP